MRRIVVVEEFSRAPFGRTIAEDGLFSGEAFRVGHLVPLLKEGCVVEVDLTGYNRYGRGFLQEAFGGLVKYEGFSIGYLRGHLRVVHDNVIVIVGLAHHYIEEAIKSTKNNIK